MGTKKKKQHYVPQCYLEAWTQPGKHQVHVYDKKLQKQRVNNIEDVASENCFYDVKFSKLLSKEQVDAISNAGYDPEKLDDVQYLENLFANEVEGDFKSQLTDIIVRARKMTPWEIKNCYFISEQNKVLFSYYLAIQFVRVKSVRRAMLESSDCLSQVLKEMKIPLEKIEEHTLNREQLPLSHMKMLLDRDNLEEMAKIIFSLSWILCINRTSAPFFTSDSPIGTIAHVKHPFLSMNGLNSKGVEVYFPVAHDLILLMYDSQYHTRVDLLDRRVYEITDLENVAYYNWYCTVNSDRCVFSYNEDFSIIQEMLVKDPELFNIPKSTLQWNGKTYTPNGGKQLHA